MFLKEHQQTTGSGFNIKLNFFDGYSSRILMTGIGSTKNTEFSYQDTFSMKLPILDMKLFYSNEK